jgi:transposase
VIEAYPTKNCYYCGTQHKMGSKKRKKPGSCGADIDRDLNGARGIFLRALAASP